MCKQKISKLMAPENLAGVFVLVFGLFGILGWAFYTAYLSACERRDVWEGYATRNPEVEIIAVVQKQYGPSKWDSTQLAVEVRGTKTGETRIILEKEHVVFNHRPQQGQLWRNQCQL